MIIKNKTDKKTEERKSKLGLVGDVYIDENRHIESLESHRLLLSSYGLTSKANTIEEAETERVAFEAWLADRLAAAQAEEGEEETDFPEEIGGDPNAY